MRQPIAMTPQCLIMLAFFLQPVAFGSWLPRIPDVAQRLGMGPAELSLTLIGLPVGIGITLPFAGPLVARIGSHNAIRYGFLAYPIAVCLPVLAFHPVALYFALLLLGISMSALELGLNVAADEVEKLTGKPVMSTCHGCWSLGIMTGNLFGSGLAALHLKPEFSVPLVAALVLIAALPLGRALPQGATTAPAKGKPAARPFFLPGLVLIGICVFAFGTTMAEGAAGDWSAIYLRQVFGSDAASAGVGYAIFAGLVAVGRLLGDWLKVRFGPVAIARFTAATAVLGFLILVFSPAYPISLIGFALGGFGVSVSFPLAVTAAAGLGDRPAAQNVAVLSLLGLSGFLIGPPLIGFVAQHFGMRWGLLVLVPGLVLSVCLAGLLRRGSTAPTAAEAKALVAGTGE
jgi:MFS family permease